MSDAVVAFDINDSPEIDDFAGVKMRGVHPSLSVNPANSLPGGITVVIGEDSTVSACSRLAPGTLYRLFREK
jgi:hypothetical protein